MEEYYACDECGDGHEFIPDNERCSSCGNDSFDTIYTCECGKDYYDYEFISGETKCESCGAVLEI